MFRMFRVLILIIVFAVSCAFAQTHAKQKAIHFDEFGKINSKEVKERTLRLREEIQRRVRAKTQLEVLIYFYQGENEVPSNITDEIVEALYENCRDCMGIDPPRITLV